MPKKQWVQTTDMVYKKRNVKERFLEKVQVDEKTGCWNWQAATRKAGGGFIYGQFSLDGYPEWAHRAAWIIWNGEIENELQVCHSCDNTTCVNPAHLFLGTQLDNIQDMLSKERDALIGEKNPSSKLTEKTVRQARHWRRKGLTFQRIADKLGVHRQTVTDAITGKTWSHL